MAWLGLAMVMSGVVACGDDTGGGSGGGGGGDTGGPGNEAIEACRQSFDLCDTAGTVFTADDSNVVACSKDVGQRCVATCIVKRQACTSEDDNACIDECDGAGGGSGSGGGSGGGTDPCQELSDCCAAKADDDPEKESCTDIAENDRTGEERDIYCENGLSSFCQ